MPEWLAFLNAWWSIPLQILGFGLAIWQIRKTRKAAVAAKIAAEGAQSQIGSNLLLVVLPQLTQLETNLEWAVSNKDRNAVIHYLGSWRWQAGQVRGHVGPNGPDSEAFLTALQTSIATAGDTKLALQDPAADISKRSKAVLRAVAEVTGMVGELTARNTLEGTKSNDRD